MIVLILRNSYNTRSLEKELNQCYIMNQYNQQANNIPYDNNGVCLDTHSRTSMRQCMQMDVMSITKKEEIYCYNIITTYFKEDIAKLLSNLKADVCKTNSQERTNQLSLELFGKPIFRH